MSLRAQSETTSYIYDVAISDVDNTIYLLVTQLMSPRISSYKGVPPGAKNALQIISLTSYACESNKEQSGPLSLDNKTQGKCRLSVKY